MYEMNELGFTFIDDIVKPKRKNQILLWEPLAKSGVDYACLDS